jgi:hypothetical protein
VEFKKKSRLVIFSKKLNYIRTRPQSKGPFWIAALLATIIWFTPLILIDNTYRHIIGTIGMAARAVLGTAWGILYILAFPSSYFLVFRKHWPSDLELCRYLREQRRPQRG